MGSYVIFNRYFKSDEIKRDLNKKCFHEICNLQTKCSEWWLKKCSRNVKLQLFCQKGSGKCWLSQHVVLGWELVRSAQAYIYRNLIFQHLSITSSCSSFISIAQSVFYRIWVLGLMCLRTGKTTTVAYVGNFGLCWFFRCLCKYQRESIAKPFSRWKTIKLYNGGRSRANGFWGRKDFQLGGSGRRKINFWIFWTIGFLTQRSASIIFHSNIPLHVVKLWLRQWWNNSSL